ncbi:MAG: hypothetical protein WB611_17760 [Stellaceae bacterium]
MADLFYMPRHKNPENRTAREEIAAVIAWAKQTGHDDVPAIQALQREPTPKNVFDAVRWANQQGFHNIADALRDRALRIDDMPQEEVDQLFFHMFERDGGFEIDIDDCPDEPEIPRQ